MKYKILAVDDNPINLKLLSRALVNSKYQILTAASGQEAFEVTVREKPDLILLDVMMPDMDGYAVCKKLQDREDTAFIPVIFLSAKNESLDKARGLALGAVDYLTKPFDPLEISARVRTHLTVYQKSIKLRRKNLELRQRLNELEKDARQTQERSAAFGYQDKINQVNFHFDNPYLELLAMVKSRCTPHTSFFVPYAVNDSQCLVLLVNGFEKDYPTLTVLLMLRKYIEGFIRHNPQKQWENNQINQLVKSILDDFSPDIYEVTFTFSVGLFPAEGKTLYWYAVHQDLPYLIGPEGAAETITGQNLDFDPRYQGLVKAITTTLPTGSMLFYYLKGTQKPDNDLLYNTIFPTFKKHAYNLQNTMQDIDENLPSGDNDQVIAVLQVK